MNCPYCKRYLGVGSLKVGSAMPQCDAVVPLRWYADAHRCPLRARGIYRGKNLCGVHLRQKNVRRPYKLPTGVKSVVLPDNEDGKREGSV